MRVSDEVRKQSDLFASKISETVGSFFFFGHDPRDGQTVSPKMYAVTARHVIEGLQRKGVEEAILRLNPKDPNANLITKRMPVKDWVFHPNDESIDVAITEIGIPPARITLLCRLASPQRCSYYLRVLEVY
jgi:hypothetical protein